MAIGMGNTTIRARFLGRKRARAFLAVAATAWPATVSAQSASDILPPTREEVTREQTTQPPIRAPRVEVEGVVERSPCALDGPEFTKIRLQIQRVEFDG